MTAGLPLKVTYAVDTDVAYLYFVADAEAGDRTGTVKQSRNLTHDIIMDYDGAGNLLGIEILNFTTFDAERLSGVFPSSRETVAELRDLVGQHRGHLRVREVVLA